MHREYLRKVVLYLYSTSNHNPGGVVVHIYGLSYISILHQTTTKQTFTEWREQLSYISILHQTTTAPVLAAFMFCCLISLFYIKPQPLAVGVHLFTVVLYLYSTSNHNVHWSRLTVCMLSYISILHQTTTRYNLLVNLLSCLISLFYIKPQHIPYIVLVFRYLHLYYIHEVV